MSTRDHQIDPESAYTEGLDTDGQLRRLGEYDCDGEFVGYIDEGRHTWASRAERDAAIGAGTYWDEFIAWSAHGGCLWPRPDFLHVLYRENVKPENVKYARADFQRILWVYEADTLTRAAYATLN